MGDGGGKLCSGPRGAIPVSRPDFIGVGAGWSGMIRAIADPSDPKIIRRARDPRRMVEIGIGGKTGGR